MDQNLSDRIRQLLRAAQRILLVAHVAPDGDAVGSLLGMGWLLQEQGKQRTLACEDPVPEIYTWLPGSADIVRQGSGQYDLLISLDCSDERRMGRVFEDRWTALPLLNIDHHVTNTQFGLVNWVDPSKAATSQMIADLVDAMGWQMTPPIASCLLNGLVTDTRCFRTHNVDAAVIQAAQRLVEAGAPLYEITRRALEQHSLDSLRLWAQAIDQSHLLGDVLWTEVTRDMRRRLALPEDGASGLANFLTAVREPKVVVVFTERENETIDVGFRSVPGIDVAAVAFRLGGGGHPQAAGCTLEGDLAGVRERVLVEVRRTLSEHRAEES
jgi:bifunctional oligoribonuclease and PAP phosphatase NrnA